MLAFGGLGEIGRNLLTVEWGDDIVVVDSGLMFPETEMLGVDLVIPDVTWLVERRDRVRGIVLTHGHEDHIGALPYILPRLDVPVYGTALTLGILRNKLREHRLIETTRLHTVRPGDSVTLGSITVEWIHTTHSVPDSCALALHTPLGVIVHSGDFKVDQSPVHGEPPDLARLARLGDQGVLLLLSDSTNAEVEGMTPSERSVGPGIHSIVEGAPGRVLVATFASNISRLQQVIGAAEEAGRRCLVVGRSMLNNVRVAQELGYLQARPGTLVSPRQAERLADAQLCILCTGAQGEPLSALSRIAGAEHPMVSLHPGDTVVLSANPIPGNEEAVHRTINNLHRLGARTYLGSAHGVHASGHAGREELRLLLTLCRPRYFLPVHGEYRHLAAHRELAIATGGAHRQRRHGRQRDGGGNRRGRHAGGGPEGTGRLCLRRRVEPGGRHGRGLPRPPAARRGRADHRPPGGGAFHRCGGGRPRADQPRLHRGRQDLGAGGGSGPGARDP